MKCEEFRERALDDVGGTLGDRAAFREHLAACPACAAMLRGIERNERILSAAEVPLAPADLWPRIAAAISAERPGALRRPRWGALAAAALLLVALGFVFSLAPAPRRALEVVVVEAGGAPRSFVPWYENVDPAEDLAETLLSPFRNDP